MLQDLLHTQRSTRAWLSNLAIDKSPRIASILPITPAFTLHRYNCCEMLFSQDIVPCRTRTQAPTQPLPKTLPIQTPHLKTPLNTPHHTSPPHNDLRPQTLHLPPSHPFPTSHTRRRTYAHSCRTTYDPRTRGGSGSSGGVTSEN